MEVIEKNDLEGELEGSGDSKLEADDNFEEFQAGILEGRGLEQIQFGIKTPRVRSSRRKDHMTNKSRMTIAGRAKGEPSSFKPFLETRRSYPFLGVHEDH